MVTEAMQGGVEAGWPFTAPAQGRSRDLQPPAPLYAELQDLFYETSVHVVEWPSDVLILDFKNASMGVPLAATERRFNTTTVPAELTHTREASYPHADMC